MTLGKSLYARQLVGFNGATAITPWMTQSTRRFLAPTLCFNGATAITPWMTPAPSASVAASESLQWGHGDHAVDDSTPPPSSAASSASFNGATAITPWMT